MAPFFVIVFQCIIRSLCVLVYLGRNLQLISTRTGLVFFPEASRHFSPGCGFSLLLFTAAGHLRFSGISQTINCRSSGY